MKFLILSVTFLVLSCNSKSKEEMRKEYDSVIKRESQLTKAIETARKVKSFMKDDTSNVILTTQIDSLAKEKDRLEKRRNELADKLFN
jgi:predicted  nucleic acid-binding Zn-ribbon protein